jgi:hypothetical protein
MSTTRHVSDVPLPAGAVRVYEWDNPGTADTDFRYFTGKGRVLHGPG